MNKNQINGKTKEIVGTVQKHAGKMVGSTSQELKGTAKEIAGKTQKKAGDLQEATKDAIKKSNERI